MKVSPSSSSPFFRELPKKVSKRFDTYST